MKYSEAIDRADVLRLNTTPEEIKKSWLYEVDCEIAEMMGVTKPVLPIGDGDLLMAAPHDNIYPLYLVAQVDYQNEEINMYQNDMEMYNNALAEAKAFYRRHNCPIRNGNWGL